MKDENKNQEEIGYVTSVSNYLVWINGLPNVKVSEIVLSESGGRGLVNSINEDLVEVMMLDEVKIQPSERFKRTSSTLKITAGNHLLSRVINPLGQSIDGKGGFSKSGDVVDIEHIPLGINSRASIIQQFETGLTLIDMLVPIALGQRELVIGDGHSGKTGFILDTIINQKNKNILCIYAVIGKPIVQIRNIYEVLRVNKALNYTVMVASSSSESASLIYLNPLVATTLAEYFQRQGNDVLLILDDLGLHAKYYREISLLSDRAPGRDAYPGDIFYQHARLLERAGKFNKKFGGGSITALPVIETASDDYSSYITTNLMGMTDGHLLFSSNRYRQGFRPSVDIYLSVSRVGRQTQHLAQKALADRIKALLARANKLQSYSRLGTEVSAETLNVLKQARQTETILKQEPLIKVPLIIQMILLGLIYTPFFNQRDYLFVEVNKNRIVDYLIKSTYLNQFLTTMSKIKDDKEFINAVSVFIPDLEKVCQVQK